MEDWITVQDAAKLADFDPVHIRRLAREGRIKARKFANVWQVSRESLQAYLAGMEEKGDRRGPKKTS